MEQLAFSLADLVKLPATKIHGKINNRKNFNESNKQDYIENNNHNTYYDMRGTYKCILNMKIDNEIQDVELYIHYSFDKLELNDLGVTLIEKRNINKWSIVEDWYRNACILQCAAYQSFAKANKNKVLKTANYAIKNGEPALKVDLKNRFLHSKLQLGKLSTFTIYVNEPEKIIQYYLAKICSSYTYTSALEWDARHKHKDFDFLHNAIVYREQGKNAKRPA